MVTNGIWLARIPSVCLPAEMADDTVGYRDGRLAVDSYYGRYGGILLLYIHIGDEMFTYATLRFSRKLPMVFKYEVKSIHRTPTPDEFKSARVEHDQISAFSIPPGPIEVHKNYTTLRCVVENVGLPQVPKDNMVLCWNIDWAMM
jgi:hypothetical protein